MYVEVGLATPSKVNVCCVVPIARLCVCYAVAGSLPTNVRQMLAVLWWLAAQCEA